MPVLLPVHRVRAMLFVLPLSSADDKYILGMITFIDTCSDGWSDAPN